MAIIKDDRTIHVHKWVGVRQVSHRRHCCRHCFHHVLPCLLPNCRSSKVHAYWAFRSFYFLSRLRPGSPLNSAQSSLLKLHHRLFSQHDISLPRNANLFDFSTDFRRHFRLKSAEMSAIIYAFLSSSSHGGRYLPFSHNRSRLRCDRMLRHNLACALWQ